MKKNWIKIVLVSVLLIIIFGILPVFSRVTQINFNQKKIDELSLKLNSSMESLTSIEEYSGNIKSLNSDYISALIGLNKLAKESDFNTICLLGIGIGIVFIVLGVILLKKKDIFNNLYMIMNISGGGIIILHIIARIISDI